jgi:hypothetical protein
LTDKPFGEEGIAPITWDGNIEGHETFSLPLDDYLPIYVQVSDRIFSVEELEGAEVMLHDGSDWTVYDAEDAGNGLIITSCKRDLNTMSKLVLAITDGEALSTALGTDVPAGLYFGCEPDGSFGVSSITFPSTIKTLDEKYIPDTIARVQDIEVFAKDYDAEGNEKVSGLKV